MEGYKIISIHMSFAMSGTYQSACTVKEALETQDITVIDSQNVTEALGILVLKAAKLREKGYDIAKIGEELNNVKFVESPVGSTISIHSESGCCGLVFLNK